MQKVYSIFDRKLKEYGSLMYAKNDFAIMRGVADAVRGSEGTLHAMHPEDFDLMYLGDFDNELGVLVPAQVVVLVDNLAELLKAAETRKEFSRGPAGQLEAPARMREG